MLSAAALVQGTAFYPGLSIKASEAVSVDVSVLCVLCVLCVNSSGCVCCPCRVFYPCRGCLTPRRSADRAAQGRIGHLGLCRALRVGEQRSAFMSLSYIMLRQRLCSVLPLQRLSDLVGKTVPSQLAAAVKAL